MNFKITPFAVVTLIFALFFIWLINGVVEPWIIETACTELVKCGV